MFQQDILKSGQISKIHRYSKHSQNIFNTNANKYVTVDSNDTSLLFILHWSDWTRPPGQVVFKPTDAPVKRRSSSLQQWWAFVASVIPGQLIGHFASILQRHKTHANYVTFLCLQLYFNNNNSYDCRRIFIHQSINDVNGRRRLLSVSDQSVRKRAFWRPRPSAFADVASASAGISRQVSVSARL